MKKKAEPQTGQYRYDAFISYRHTEPDKTVAERLQKLLEGYRSPPAVAKASGYLRIGRVFRDRDELPTSGDLGHDIDEALRQSRYLIVVCSPRTPASRWCASEIETFRAMHGNDRILALLIEGEPDEAFPPALSTYQSVTMGENGVSIETQVMVEPLAADIRADTPQKSLRLLKQERLRLLAPMLGCSYDELRQRQRERRLKRIIAAALSAAAAASMVGLVILMLLLRLGEANREVVQKNTEIFSSNSRYLADEALKLFDQGDRLKALMVAMEALPQDIASPDRPVVAEAESALSVIYTSNLPSTTILHTEGIPRNAQFSPDGTLIAVEESGGFTIWDALSGNRITRLKDAFPHNAYKQFTADSRYYRIGFYYWDVRTGERIGKVPEAAMDMPLPGDPNRHVSPMGKFIYEVNDLDENPHVVLTASDTGKSFTIPVPYVQPTEDMKNHNQHYMVYVQFFLDESRLALFNAGRFYLWDTAKRCLLLQSDTDDPDTVSFSPDGKLLALQQGEKMAVYNAATLSVKADITAPANGDVKRAWFSDDGSLVFLVYEGKLCYWDWSGYKKMMSNQSDIPERTHSEYTSYSSSYTGRTTFYNDDSYVSADGAALATIEGSEICLFRGDWIKYWRSEKPAKLKGHTGSITSVEFSPDGTRLLTASSDSTVRIWDIGRKPANIELYRYADALPYCEPDIHAVISDTRVITPTDQNAGATFFPDLRENEPDNPYREYSLRDRETGREIARIADDDKEGVIFELVPIADGDRFITRSYHGEYDLWDSKTGKRLAALEYMNNLVFNDGCRSAAYYDTKSGNAVLLDVYHGTKTDEVDIPALPESAGVEQFNRRFLDFQWLDGSTLSLVKDSRLYAFRVENGRFHELYPAVKLGGDADAGELKSTGAARINGILYYTVKQEDKGNTLLFAYDLRTGKQLFERQLDMYVEEITDGKTGILVHGKSSGYDFNHSLSLLDCQTGKTVAAQQFPKEIDKFLALTGRRFLVTFADNSILLTGLIDGTEHTLNCRANFANPTGSASTTYTCSPDGNYIALRSTMEGYNSLMIYSVQRDAPVATIRNGQSVTFTQDGKGYVVCSNGYCGYCPFMGTPETMEYVRKELAEYHAELTPEERKTFFID